MPPLATSQRLAFIATQLRIKHPNMHPKAVQNLARHILDLQDQDNLSDDETQEPEQKEEPKERKDSPIEKAEENLSSYRIEQESRLQELIQQPAYKSLFSGKSNRPNKPARSCTADQLGRTALHVAAYNNNLEEIRKLIKEIDPHIKDNGGNTAYIIAVREGHTEVAQFLAQC